MLTPVVLSIVLFTAGSVFFGVLIGKLVWLGVPYSLCVGAGLTWIAQSAWRRRGLLTVPAVAAVGLLALLQAQGLRNLYDSPNPAWDQAAGLTRQRYQPGDVVMDDPENAAHAYNYYLTADGLDLPHVYPQDGDPTKMLAWAARFRRIWVPVPEPPLDNLMPDILRVAEHAGLPVRMTVFRSAKLYLIVPSREGHVQ